MTKQILRVTVKSAYGRDLVYPCCMKARLLASLCKTSTFTQQQMEYIEALGYEFQTSNGGLV